MDDARPHRRLRLALLFALPLAAYSLAPRNGFVGDDHQTIERGLYTRSLANVPQLFTHDNMWNADGGRFHARARIDTFRPLTMTSFFVDHALFGMRPAAFHLVNLALHLVNVLLVFGLARRLGASEGASLIAALAFGVHPATCEAVHWINGRFDELATLFVLAAATVWLDGLDGQRAWWRPLGVGLLVFAATLSKETAFVLAPPIALVLVGRQLGWRRVAIVLAPWVAGGAAGLGCRRLGIEGVRVAVDGQQLAYALARLPLLWLDGLRVLALPQFEVQTGLIEQYREVPAARLALGLALAAALVALALHRLWRGRPALAVGVGAFLLSLGPIALLTFVRGWSGWGRYLYPSSALLALPLATAIDALAARLSPSLRRPAQVAAALALAACAAQTFLAGRAFRDDRAFFTTAIADHPDAPSGYFELAQVELGDGHADRARTLVAQAITLVPPGLPFAWARAGMVAWRAGDHALALSIADRAFASEPRSADARLLHAAALVERGEAAEGARLLAALVAEDIGNREARLLLTSYALRFGPKSPFGRQAGAVLP